MKPRIALVYLGRRGGGPVYSLEMAKALEDYAELLCVVFKAIREFGRVAEGTLCFG